MAVDRSALLKLADRRYAEVEVPDAGTVRIQSLTEAERSSIEIQQIVRGRREIQKLVEVKSLWIIAAVVDEYGARLFSDADLPKIMGLDSRVTDLLYTAIQLHAGVTKEDREALLKNSQRTDGAGSPSVSP